MRSPTKAVTSTAWRHLGATESERTIPEETAVAFTYEGSTYAVMMATPQDLEDFAFGFSFTEGLIASPADIRQLDIIDEDAGIELRMWLSEPRRSRLVTLKEPSRPNGRATAVPSPSRIGRRRSCCAPR